MPHVKRYIFLENISHNCILEKKENRGKVVVVDMGFYV